MNDKIKPKAKPAARSKAKSGLFNEPKFIELCHKLDAQPDLLEELVDSFVKKRLDEKSDILTTIMEVGIARNFERNKERLRLEFRLEIAEKMLTRGYDVKTISEITNLTVAKVKTLTKKPTKKAA